MTQTKAAKTSWVDRWSGPVPPTSFGATDLGGGSMFVADPGEKLVLEARTGWILPSDLLKTSFLMVPSSTLPGINMEVEKIVFQVPKHHFPLPC